MFTLDEASRELLLDLDRLLMRSFFCAGYCELEGSGGSLFAISRSSSSLSSADMFGRMSGKTQVPTVKDRMKKKMHAENTEASNGARRARPLWTR